LTPLQPLKFDVSESNKGKYWRRVVGLYTELELTKLNDLLPALAGVVECEMSRSEREDDVCMAGMWKSSTLEDLIFYVFYQRDRAHYPSSTTEARGLGFGDLLFALYTRQVRVKDASSKMREVQSVRLTCA
jgi:hypothetical protein